MTFDELKKLMEDELGIIRLADIARELEVTPQVVSNWKSRNQVPYKYVKEFRKKLKDRDSATEESRNFFPPGQHPQQSFLEGDEKSIQEYFILLYRIVYFNKITVLLFPIIFLIISIINLRYYEEPVYQSKAKIVPISTKSKASSSISNLAQQFGVGGVSQNQVTSLSSAEMFPEIIKSRRLAGDLLNDRFDTKKYGKNKRLITILYKSNDDLIIWSNKAKKRAISKLLGKIRVNTGRDKPLLTIYVKSSEPQFSADLNDAIIKKLQVIVNKFEDSRIKDKKKFIEKRLHEVEIDLTKAEDKMKVFRQRNRIIIQSPALLLEQERLMRELEVQTQIYITLKSQYELIQIEEIGSGSRLQILDPPEAPTKKISPKPMNHYAIAIILGFIFSIAFVFAVDWYKDNRSIFKLN